MKVPKWPRASYLVASVRTVADELERALATARRAPRCPRTSRQAADRGAPHAGGVLEQMVSWHPYRLNRGPLWYSGVGLLAAP
jgi:hypothetical protein